MRSLKKRRFLSGIAHYKDKNGALNIAEGSISLCTYEALEKIGFKDETIADELKDIFMEALDAMTETGHNRENTGVHGSGTGPERSPWSYAALYQRAAAGGLVTHAG